MTGKALEGLKVVDFCWVAAGPVVGLYLAQNGATVVRIESTHRPDPMRAAPPFRDSKPGINRSAYWASCNSGKLGMSLNLKHPKGLEIARKLIEWGDVVGENFAPGVITKMGLGYEEVRKIKPDTIMYSSSNLGQTGFEATQPGYGLHLVGYAGFTHLTGWPDRIPSQPFAAYTDFVVPRILVAAIMAALDYRRRTGKGQYLDLSQLESAIHFMAPTVLDYTVNNRIKIRDGNRSPHAAPHGAYPCKGTDRWCAIGVFSDEEWKSLCRVMGYPEWSKDNKFATLPGRKQYEDELNERLSSWTSNLAAEDVMEKLQTAGVPAGVVQSSEDVLNDPQLAHRRYFWPLEHPEIGEQHFQTAGGFTLSETPGGIESPAPTLGQHTQQVCQEILGMSNEEFVTLYNDGVFE